MSYEITQSLLPILSLANLDLREEAENERDCCPSCPETSWEFSDESVTLELKYYMYICMMMDGWMDGWMVGWNNAQKMNGWMK